MVSIRALARLTLRRRGLLKRPLLAMSNQPLGAGLAVLLVAFAIVGTSASRLVLDRVTDANFRQITQRLVLTLGVGYLAAGIWQLLQ